MGDIVKVTDDHQDLDEQHGVTETKQASKATGLKLELTVVTAARSFKKVAPSVSVKPEVDPEEEDPAEENFNKLQKELERAPELQSILVSERYPFEKKSIIEEDGDYVALYFEVTKRLKEKAFAPKLVEQEIDSLFEIMIKQNAINKKSSERVAMMEAEMAAMSARFMKDPRVITALSLSNKWRLETHTAELTINELSDQMEELVEKNESLSKTLDKNKDIIRELRNKASNLSDDRSNLDQAQEKIFLLYGKLKDCYMTAREYMEINAKLEKDLKQQKILNRRETPSHINIKGFNSKASGMVSQTSMNMKLKAYDQKRAYLSAQIAVEQKKVDVLSKKLKDRDVYVDTLERKVDDVLQANNALKTYLSELRTRQEGAFRNLGLRSARIAYWEKEFSTAKADSMNLRHKVFKQEQELIRLRWEKGLSSNKKHEVEVKYQSCQKCCDKLKNDMSISEMLNNRLSTEIQEKSAQNQHLTLLKDMQRRMLKERDANIKKNEDSISAYMLFSERLMKEIECCGVTLMKVNRQKERHDRHMHELKASVAEVADSYAKERRTVERRQVTIRRLISQMAVMDEEIRVNLKAMRQCTRKTSLAESEFFKLSEVVKDLHRSLVVVQQEATTSNFKYDKLEAILHKMDIVERKQMSDIKRMEAGVISKDNAIEELMQKLRICSEEIRNFNVRTRQLYDDLDKETLLSREYEKQRNTLGLRLVQMKTHDTMTRMRIEEAEKVILKGKLAYDSRVKDIYVLKKEVSNLRGKNKALTFANDHNSQLKPLTLPSTS